MPNCSSLYHYYYYYCNLSYTDSPQLSVYFSISVGPTFKSGAKSCEKSKLQQLQLRSQGRPWLYDSVIRAESGVLWKNNAAVEMFICISGIFLHFLIYKIRQDSGKLMHWLKYVVLLSGGGGRGGSWYCQGPRGHHTITAPMLSHSYLVNTADTTTTIRPQLPAWVKMALTDVEILIDNWAETDDQKQH